MGKVEKLVVLSVLFLIAVILVVSLTTDNPLDKAGAAVLGDKTPAPSNLVQNQTPSVQAPAPGKSPSTLLSANVQEGSPAQGPQPAAAAAAPTAAPVLPLAIPSGSILKSVEGLSRSFDDQRFFYTWQSGDSYVSVATRLYAEPTKFTLVKNANEGREDMQPGDKILVPIFDVEPPVAKTGEAAKQPETKTADKPRGEKTSAAGRVHVVKKGESLWKIAKAELGDGNRWKEIYDLNKDRMKSPEALRDGMQLKLP